jgi:hypothetical protein
MYGIFNSTDILTMQNQTVEAIASENKETRDKRMALKVQKKAIEEARDICANLAMRKELRQHAEEDYLEESSDEDGQPKTPSRRDGTVRTGTASPKERRRSTRQSREERPLAQIMSPEVVSGAASYTMNSSAPVNHVVPRVEVQRSPVEWNETGAEGFYKAPQQAPPPPPRPEKLRPDLVDAGFPPTPPDSAHAHRNSQLPAPGRDADEYRFSQEADYAPGTRRVSSKKLFPRA